MSTHAVLREKLQRSCDLFDAFVVSLSDEDLSKALPNLPSNTIGEQLWCVVGARESYQRAIAAGAWAGFSCSIDAEGIASTERVLDALRASASNALETLTTIGSPTTEQARLIVDLLEHEAAHQGQLIRYLYGLQLEIPKSWKVRFSL